MKYEQLFPFFYRFYHVFYEFRARAVSRRSCCRVCYIIAVVFVCLALTAVPSFASSDVQVVPFYTLSKLDYGGTTSVIGISSNWTSVTAVTAGKYASPLFYKLPETLIAGQSYIVSFDYTGDDFMYILSLYKSNQWEDFNDSNRFVYAEGDSTEHGGHIEASFVYNGEPYLSFQFVIAPNRVVRLSPLTLTRVNPNAGVESRLDEQNSMLFDGEEVNTLPDDGLDNHINSFKSKFDELKSNLNNVDLLERVKRGMMTFNLFFDAFIYNGEQIPYQVKWILPLVNLSLFLGIVGAVLGIVKASRGKKDD